jgi:hypothetical protein
MSEMPPEQRPIPLVKLSGTPDYAPQPARVGEDVFVICELVNMGTGPTSAADQLWASLVLQSTVVTQEHQDLDSPPLDPNGGSKRYSFKFDGRFVAAAEDWSISVAVTNAAGDIADEATVAFTVSPRESG